MVFSIFFEVEPTVVRKQTRSFHEAFAKHEEAFRENTEKVQNWRHALTEVANPSGWHLKDRHEGEFIQEIVKEISRKKGPRTLGILDDLVEMNSRLKKLRLLLDAESRDVRMIGICGMGGVDIEIRNDFGGIQMIKRELRRRNVLVVIDDAVHIRQLNRVDGVYKVEKLDDDEALELFNKRAFGGQPSEGYVELIKRIVKYADGLPFALETLGTEAVEGIMLDFSNEEVHLTASAKAFLKMTNLRLLKILNLQLPAGLESLSDELRLLQWHGYPLKSLPKWTKLWNVTCVIGALNNFGRESK
ncbi:hypothetical protein WN943_006275 [Citrus x changshan-huyou]